LLTVFRIIALLPMDRVFAPEQRLFDDFFDRKLPRRWPGDFRKLMFWVFAFTSVGFLGALVYKIPRILKVPLLWNILMGPISALWIAAICGAAAWTIWKAKPSARGWAIAASLTYILFFLLQFFFPTRNIWFDRYRQLELLGGLLGVICFAWPDKQADSPRV
jgi:hypothetical protein